MKPSHEFALRALGIIPPHPEKRQPQAPAEQQRDAHGRFTAPPGVTLGGGVGYTPLPSPPPDGYAGHTALLADLLAAKDLGA